jgi:hypothetical protein
MPRTPSPARPARPARREQFVEREAEALDREVHLGPLVGQEAAALGVEQQAAHAVVHEHAAPAPRLDQVLVDQLLIALEHGERVHAQLGGHGSHRRKWIALAQRAVENHGDHPVAELPVDGLAVIPVGVH